MRAPGQNGGILWPGLLVGALLLAMAGVFFTILLSSDFGDGGRSLFTPRVWRLFWISSVQAGLSTVISLLAGILLAWCLHHQANFRGRALLIGLLSTAMVLPTLIVVLGLVTVFGRSGWLSQIWALASGVGFNSGIYGLGGILLAHSYLNAPFVARNLLIRLDAIPIEQQKLAASLDLLPLTRFRLLEWPAMANNVFGLGVTVFLLCFTSFAIVLTLGGSPSFNTLEVAIYEAVRLDFDLAYAAKLALLQLLVCGSLIWFASRYQIAATAVATARPWTTSNALGIYQQLIIAVFGVLFLLPLLAIVIDGVSPDLLRIFQQPSFQRALATSLLIASLSALITLLLAWSLEEARVTLTAASRRSNLTSAALIDHLLSFAAMMFLAVPALVLGLGLFLLARLLTDDLLAVGPVAVLLANVLLALPFAMTILMPGARNAAARYDRLAQSIGLSGFTRWRLIEWPVMRAELGLAAALAFCFSFGDLGVIALFGNQDFITLPWLLYQKFGSYRTDEAAAIALVMLVLTLVVFLAVPRLIAGKRHAQDH